MRLHQPIRRARIAAIAAAFVTMSVSAFGQSGQSSLSLAVQAAAQNAAQQPGETVRRLSIDEAVKLAMEQNLGIRIQRIDPQIQDVGVALARSSWAPAFSTSLTRQSQSSASTSSLSGGATSIDNGTFATGVSLAQTLPWGGNYTANWNSSRFTTTNLFSSFSPQLSSNLNLQFTQPLLRNFQIDPIRQQVAVSKKVARPVRHPARKHHHADAAERQKRLLGSLLLHQQPEGAAGIARAVAAVAEGQPEARRDRHDGADRHRAGAGRGRHQRVERHRRRSGDQAGAGQPARADPRPRDGGLLDRRLRTERRGVVRRARDRPRRRGAERARQAVGPAEREERASSRATSTSSTTATRSNRM